MSSYGPPAGGYPPQEPWRDQPGHGQPGPWQTPPTDPWGGHPSPSGGYEQDPGGYQPGPGYPPGPPYQPGPEPSWGQPPPPPPPGNSRRTVLIVVVAVLALLLGVGGFATFFLANRDTPQATPGPSTSPTSSAEATTPASTGDFRTVTKGQCVVNDGTEKDPKIRIVPCAKNTLLVLERVNGTVDKNRCATVKDYEFFFFYDSTLDSLDFVLCMKKSS